MNSEGRLSQIEGEIKAKLEKQLREAITKEIEEKMKS
jgi:anti-anti-sigma regulatory factor